MFCAPHFLIIALTNKESYDAVTKDNRKAWQNTLNENNKLFAIAAGSVMPNYWWDSKDHGDNKSKVAEALKTAEKDNIILKSVYFGIECWAQSLALGYETYGVDDTMVVDDITSESGAYANGLAHGGTATGLAVRPLAKYGLGTGIFSAYWAYPHFWRDGHKGEGDMYSRAVDRFMWEGTPDLEHMEGLECSCLAESNVKCLEAHMRGDFKNNPINNHVERYPTGSEGFFHTDYKEFVYYQGPKRFRAHIGQQSILPAPAERSAELTNTASGNKVGTISAILLNNPSRCTISIKIEAPTTAQDETQLKAKLPLHQISASRKLELNLIVTYQKLADYPGLNPGLNPGLFFDYGGSSTPQNLTEKASLEGKSQTFYIGDTNARITAIGIRI